MKLHLFEAGLLKLLGVLFPALVIRMVISMY
jgi:hypothetical protein